jgi:Fur family ferric uptake transcriptional regulator
MFMNKPCNQHRLGSKEQLKAGGLKVTAARLGLLDLLKHAKKPLSIKQMAKLSGAGTDLVTIYRNTESLLELKLVTKVNLGGKEACYELNGKHHHHIVCENCGKVSDIKNCHVALQKNTLKDSGFAALKNHSLEFFGLCLACSK